MNFRNLMIVTVVTAGMFGAGLVVAPALIGGLYGMSSTPISDAMARLYGTALLGIVVLSWQIRNSQDGDIQKPVLLAFFITDFGGFLVMLFAQLSGLMNALGWSVVGLLLILSAAYAYLRFAK